MDIVKAYNVHNITYIKDQYGWRAKCLWDPSGYNWKHLEFDNQDGAASSPEQAYEELLIALDNEATSAGEYCEEAKNW